MRDAEIVIEALRIACEDLERPEPRDAVDRALVGLAPKRAAILRPDVLKMLEAYDVKTFADLSRVYRAQVRAHESQNAPALRGESGKLEGQRKAGDRLG